MGAPHLPDIGQREVETFEIGHTWTMEQLMKKYDFADPVLFSIVLGHEVALFGIGIGGDEALFQLIGFLNK